MSLLNEALRKRNKEPNHSEKGSSCRSEQKSRLTRKIKIYGLVFLGLFASGTIVEVWHLYFSTSRALRQPHIAEHISTPIEQGAPSNKINLSSESNIEQVGEDKEELQGKPVIAERLDQKKTETAKINSRRKKPLQADLQKKIKDSKVKKEIGSEFPFYQKAISYHHRGELQKAIQMYLEVLKKNPEHRDSLFNLVSAYIETSAFSEAYPLLQQLRDRDPKSPQVLLNLAITEIGLGRPHEALSLLDKAELLNGPRFAVYLHRGVAFSQLGRFDEAMTWYKRAEEIYPNQPLLLFNTAVLYDKWQKYAEALRYYDAFLKQGQSFNYQSKEIKSRIKTLRAYLARQADKSMNTGDRSTKSEAE